MNKHTLSKQFTRMHDALLDFVDHCSADEWERTTAEEGWRVGVTAHHIGAVHYSVIDQVQMILDGVPPTITTLEDVDRLNKAHVKEYARCMPAETRQFLVDEARRVTNWFETLAQQDLEKTAHIEFMGGCTSGVQLLQVVLIDLAQGHLRSVLNTTSIKLPD